ncbi:MAG: hypothetical protein KTR30_06300 [Saprospiraceae bacterium]|nr:hypothetical protein [Saprospiraceae bacterium]
MDSKIVYVDMDGVLCDFEGAHQQALSRQPEIAYPQSQYGFFRNLEPLNNALESVELLRQIPALELYILTAPSIYNPLCYVEKREWVETHLGMEWVRKLIISPNKGLSKGHYLIDDHADGRGQESFEGKLLQFGSGKFPDWLSITSYFTNKYRKGEL